jgi:HEAT repeat protein
MMTWLLPPLRPNFPAALRDVHARSAQLRIAAAERLASPTDAEGASALTGLRTLADDPDARVRAAAMKALGEFGCAAGRACLVAHLADDVPVVRELALVALASLAPELARPALLGALGSPHPELRFQAVAGLAEHAVPADLPLLAHISSADPDPKVRAQTARCLRQFGLAASSALHGCLRDPGASVRAEAAISLASLGDATGVEALGEAVEDPEFTIEVLDAIAGLRLQALRESAAAIAESVLQPRLCKVAAARALIRLQDPRGVPALRQVLRGFRNTARSYAVRVVGELGVDELTGELVRLTRRFRGTDPETLAEALGRLLPLDLQARSGLEKLAQRGDRAGAEARRMLASIAANGCSSA